MFGLDNYLPVVITELAAPFRILPLGGLDKPEVPLEKVQRQRTKRTWYPGSGTANTQVLGVEHEAIVLRGWFKDPLTFADGGPEARVKLVAGLLQGQNKCQLAWGTHTIVWGRVAGFRERTYSTTRVQYEITFEIDQSLDQAAPVPLPIIASGIADVKAAAGQLSALTQIASGAVTGILAVGTLVS